MSIIQERIQEFFQRFPRSKEVFSTLNEAGIPFVVAGSGCLFLLGNDRLPDDVDIFLPDDKHDEADLLFQISSFQYTSVQESVRNSNPFDEHAYQLTSHLLLKIEGKEYVLNLTKEQIRQSQKVINGDISFYLLSPEDVLLIKALLQRGEDVGKHDLKDIEKFLSHHNLDRMYLSQRIAALHAEDRIRDIFN